jgi:tRNA G18 (ribose-2'-O)-methylase SpoU
VKKAKNTKPKTKSKENSREICVVLPNIRSAHNVGSIFRTADALGVTRIFLAGYTPTPIDKFNRSQKEIAKTALGAEKTILWKYEFDPVALLKRLKKEGFVIVAVEQDSKAVDYKKFTLSSRAEDKIVFVVGNEVEGLSNTERNFCDHFVEIPMKGKKESLNVVVSFAVALFRILNI